MTPGRVPGAGRRWSFPLRLRRAVDVSALEFCFAAVAAAGPASAARLAIVAIPGAGECLACGLAVPMDSLFGVCPGCGSHRLRPTAGTGMRVREIEIE